MREANKLRITPKSFVNSVREVLGHQDRSKLNTFKIGDHVEFLGGEDYWAKRGSRAVVIGVGPGDYLEVAWETTDKRHGSQADGGYEPSDFVRMKMINRGEYKSAMEVA